MPDSCLTLARTENQALALGRFATDFLAGRYGEPGDRPIQRVEQFHLDSVACAVSAIACGTNAPGVLRREAFSYPASDPSRGATCFGSTLRVMPEKAVAANCAAVREWDANGTNFGYRPELGHTRGEFGHNDYYPVIIAAAQVAGADGPTVLRGMLLVDEIRGRLAEVFSLRAHKIDHVVHGAIASAVVYGAMVGASAEQIESAVGLVVAHYIPFRAIRAGEQLSDSKGASAALAAEMAVLSVRRAVAGFVGPGDIFRNPQAIFCLYEKPARQGKSPFDLTLTVAGDDFAVMGMHFKLGLYEHQAAGAIQGLLDVLAAEPRFLHDPGQLRAVRITIYEPAFGIIGDPAKRNPRTRQSADHSMVYIIGTLLRKAFEQGSADWRELMLMPEDYSDAAIFNPLTRSLMERIEFRHGGPEYDAQYPDGLPTTVELEHAELGRHSSGLVLYPTGHARNTSADLAGLLAYKFQRLAAHGVTDVAGLQRRISGMQQKTAAEIDAIYDFQ
ncbi:MAG: MmgE/PrpD family protein, partial [Pirellulales bacterium]